MVLETEQSHERRHLKRVTIKLPVTLQGPGIDPPITGETLNIHEQGLAFTSNTFLSEGTRLTVTITLPTGPIGLSAQVAWSTSLNILALKPTRCAIGLQFTSLSEKDKASLMRFILQKRDK